MKQKEKVFDLHVVGRVLFAVYLVALIYFMFFAESLGRGEASEFMRYNLVPFREIRRCIEYWDTLGAFSAGANLFGNVIAFVPFGMFLPYLWKKAKKLLPTIFAGFLLSLFVELTQLVSHRGSFDVDDLLLNTIGAVIGYWIYYMVKIAESRFKNKKR